MSVPTEEASTEKAQEQGDLVEKIETVENTATAENTTPAADAIVVEELTPSA